MSMPSYWYGAGPDFSGLNNAYASQGQTNAYLNNQANTLAQANAYNPWANTPGGFGGQTAYYAGLGAAYGRAVGPSQPSVFDTGAAPYQDYGNPSLGAGQPNYFSGSTPISSPVGPANDPASMAYYQHNPDVAAAGVNAYDHWKNFGQNEGRQSFGVENVGAGRGMDWNSYFNTVTSGGGEGPEAEYLLANPDVAAAAQRAGGDVNAFAAKHYQDYGKNEGRKFFDANAYYQQNPDVWEAGANPFQHYNQYGRNEGRAAPMTSFDARWYGEQNPDVVAAGMDPAAHWFQFGQKEGRFGANPLATQRQSYAETARQDPNLMFKLAAKAMQEDQNSSEGRTAVVEAMLNRLNATQQDPLNPKYYPTNKEAYNAEIEQRLRNNPALLQQVTGDIERAFGGSNLAKYGTNWSSGDTWLNEKKYVTPTQAMGANQFYIKDLNVPDASGNSWAGAGNVAKNKLWFNSVTGALPY
jgi:hypothetical protein